MSYHIVEPSLSTTFHSTADRFLRLPGIGASRPRAEGSWFRDGLELSDLGVANFSMGITYNGTTNSGVLGLGFPNPNDESFEDGLIWALVNQGVATTEAFSIWLAS